jgi:hypothetical protein
VGTDEIEVYFLPVVYLLLYEIYQRLQYGFARRTDTPIRNNFVNRFD